MIEPALSGDAFLDDVAQAPRESSDDGFRLWWLGQSGFLVQHAGRHLLFDPYLSDSLTRKYAGTDTPHVRMTERVVAPERLDFIDVATSTHNHTDHLDAHTLGPLLEANPGLTLVVPAANRAFAADRLGVAPNRLTGLTAGASIEAAGFRLHGVPAAHEALERDEEGRHTFMGYVAQFGPHTVYHSGDTVRFDGQVEALAPFDIDVALLPINGRDHPAPGNLDGKAAAQLAKDIGAGLAVPCHFEMFEFNTAPPDAFEAVAERIGQPYRTLRAGERLTRVS